jgi:hypothetical protein
VGRKRVHCRIDPRIGKRVHRVIVKSMGHMDTEHVRVTQHVDGVGIVEGVFT